MLKTPWDFQVPLIDNSIKRVYKKNWILVQSPTGSGKTVIMSHIISRGLQKGVTFLVLSESANIFVQLCNEFGAFAIDSNVKYMAVLPGKCYVAMSQTLVNRQRIIDQFLQIENLILIIDEAHIGTTRKVIVQFPGRRMGFTATPDYKTAKFLPDLYNDIVVGPQPFELQQKDQLCTYRHIGPEGLDEDDLEISKSTKDYTEQSQEYAFNKAELFDGLYEDLEKLNGQYRKAMVYCASIAHCENVSQHLTEHGFKNVIYHSKEDLSQQNLLTFMDESSDVNFCVSVAALTKGWDFKPLDLIVLWRSTTSLALYMQMVGRGGRIYRRPDGTLKNTFICLDYGKNYPRHLAWDSERDWPTLWLPPKNARQKEQPAPVKQCPQCESFVHTSVMLCKWCGYEFPREAMQLEARGELIEYNAAYIALIGRKVSSLDAEELAAFCKEKNMVGFCTRVATAWEQVSPGWLKQFGAAMGYNVNWAYMKRRQVPAIDPLKAHTVIRYQDFEIK